MKIVSLMNQLGMMVVVVGQRVGSISSKPLANDCLCTLEVVTTSMIATSSHGHLEDFLPMQCLSMLFLKEFTVLLLTILLGWAFRVEVILIR